MGNKLAIEVKEDSDGVLVGFPFLEDQFADGEEEEDGGDSIFVYVDLGERTDTTAKQEQHLNTNPNVIGYSIL